MSEEGPDYWGEVSCQGPRSPSGPARVWVEKTHVKGRADRLEGEFALGRALWSPARDRGGNDTYRFMRDVRDGDIILHLTDGEGFTGVSRAAQPYVEFGGVPNTEWGEQPSYLIRLRDFEQLDPPLSREIFFRGQWGSRLSELHHDHKDLFYHSGLALRQGAYLTPLPSAIFEVLLKRIAVSSQGPSLVTTYKTTGRPTIAQEPSRSSHRQVPRPLATGSSPPKA